MFSEQGRFLETKLFCEMELFSVFYLEAALAIFLRLRLCNLALSSHFLIVCILAGMRRKQVRSWVRSFLRCVRFGALYSVWGHVWAVFSAPLAETPIFFARRMFSSVFFLRARGRAQNKAFLSPTYAMFLFGVLQPF